MSWVSLGIARILHPELVCRAFTFVVDPICLSDIGFFEGFSKWFVSVEG